MEQATPTEWKQRAILFAAWILKAKESRDTGQGAIEFPPEVDLRAGQAVVWRNTLFHGRRGPVGNRLMIRFWVTALEV